MEAKPYKSEDDGDSASDDQDAKKLDADSASDFKAVADKADSGDLESEERDIDEVIVKFDKSNFDALASDKEDDTVVCVLRGYVDAISDDEVFVCFSKASVVHGSMVNNRPGSGERFAKLEGELEKEPGVRNPGALAAAIGRKKYGNAKMAKWSAAGKESNS